MTFASNSRAAALALGITLLAAPALADPAPVGDAARGLQAMRELNLILLGDMNGGHDVEGKAYIGGNLSNGATFGQGRSNQGFTPSSRPTLTVGGDAKGNIHIKNGPNGATPNGVTPSGAVIGGNAGDLDPQSPGAVLLVGGSIDHTNGVTNGVIQAGGSLGSNPNPTGALVQGNLGAGFSPVINALPDQTAQLGADLQALSTALAGLAPTTSFTSGDMNGFTINAVDGGGGYAVFDITTGQTFFDAFNSLTLNLPTLADGSRLTTIINVSGSTAYSMNFNDNNSFANPYIIWNFIGAKTIAFNRQFNGSVLALGATISNSTDIEGSIVATNFNQGGEVHLGTFAGKAPPLPPPPPPGVPEPATWAMLILGFFGLGQMVRRRRLAAA